MCCNEWSICNYNGDVIYENPFDRVEVKALHLEAARNGHEMAFFNADNITVTTEDCELIAKNYQRVGREYLRVDNSFYLNEPIHLLLLFCKEGEETNYKERFPYFQFVRNSPYGCDVYPTGKSKAIGIEKLISHLNFMKDATYAFGDGINDLEMFQLVQHPIAMENAADIVKQSANFITKSNNEDGIFHGLKMCQLLI